MAGTDHLARRQGALDEVRPRRCRGAAQGGRRCARQRQGQAQEGHPRHFPRLGRDVQERHGLRFREAGTSLPRTGLPQFGRAHPAARQPARGNQGARSLLRRRDRRFREVARSQQAGPAARSDRHLVGTRRDRDRRGAGMERFVLRKRPVLHQQHPPARWRHPSCRLPRRADPHAQQLCGKVGPAQEGEGEPFGRGYARGADRDRLGQAARSQVLQPDQGQAGVLRGAPAA